MSREQIAFALRRPAERLIAADLADALDEAGYLRADIGEIADRLGAGTAEVEAVLAKCQASIRPASSRATWPNAWRSSSRARDRLDPAMAGAGRQSRSAGAARFRAAEALCGVDEEDLLDMLRRNPRRSTRSRAGPSTAARPIRCARRLSCGPRRTASWAVELNPDTLPRVLVNQTYYRDGVARHARRGEERDFLSDCLQSANWLARSLDQRARTILKVATEIVRQQDAFLAMAWRICGR